MGLEGLYGFGCADLSPGKDWRPGRGFYYVVMLVVAASRHPLD